MVEEETKRKIQAIADKIVREYKPEKIILFGSYAWGEPHEDSDLDFFIVKKTDDPMLKRMEDVGRIFLRCDFPMDFIVYTPDQVERRKKMKDQFVSEIINNGELLYAK